MKRTNKLLAAVFTDTAIYVSEVEADGGNYSLKKTARLDTASLRNDADIPAAAQQFAQLLKTGGFTAKRFAAAVNSRNVMTINLKIAAMRDRELIEQAVKFEMERKLELDIDDVRFDFTNTLTDGSSEVFAVLTLKKHIDAVYAIAKVAKLTVESITVASCPALSGAGGSAIECSIVSLDDSSQISIAVGGEMRFFKHITNTGGSEHIAADICRAINQYVLASQVDTSLVNCNVSADNATTQAVVKELKKISITAGPAASSYGFDGCDESFAGIAAAHLACSILSGNKPCIDLKNRKHSSKRKANRHSLVTKISAAVAVLLILCGVFFYNWRSDYSRLEEINAQIQSISSQVKGASAMMDKIGYTKKWFAAEPLYLEVLKKLTNAFPEEGTIWLTSFGSDESMNSIITGCALEEKVVLDVLDVIKKDPSFKDTRIVYIRKTGKSSSVITFAFNFKYSQEH